MTSLGKLKEAIIPVDEIDKEDYDGIIIVASPEQVADALDISRILVLAIELDNGLKTEVGVLPAPNLKNKRIIFSPTGCVDEDYDDVRCFKRAANSAMLRAIKAGVQKPIVFLLGHPNFNNSPLVTLLGILEKLYVPLQIRELDPNKLHNITKIGVFTKFPDEVDNLIRIARILEVGRRVARDIAETDPERMSPPKLEEYVTNLFSGSTISIKVIKDPVEIAKEYPLFEAVNRAASMVSRHQGRIIFLEYKPKENITKTLFLIGKGVTFDTGGTDLKVGGHMIGMSRDKSGAAAVVGFMQIVHMLQPQNIRVVGGISVVRNSIGSNSYVVDELIRARSGALIRIGNTDAEGRMVMADVLCKFKEMALGAINPHIYTIATLTGHAVLTVGEGYNIVIDNGPAKREKHAQKLQTMGQEIGDPVEISTLRREDFDINKGQVIGDDILQCNPEPSARTKRGHQRPFAFLIMAAGLHKHGSGDKQPLKYSHFDIAASSLTYPAPSTGSPILVLANMHLLNVNSCSQKE